jgi:hypothetical protein
MFGVMTFISLAMASLWQPWRSWAPELVLSTCVFLLLLSIPASIYAPERAFFVGFASVGWGYLLLVFSPLFETTVGRQLLARPIAESICFSLTGSLGDLPQFLRATQTLFMFGLALLGGVTARQNAHRNRN